MSSKQEQATEKEKTMTVKTVDYEAIELYRLPRLQERDKKEFLKALNRYGRRERVNLYDFFNLARDLNNTNITEWANQTERDLVSKNVAWVIV